MIRKKIYGIIKLNTFYKKILVDEEDHFQFLKEQFIFVR